MNKKKILVVDDSSLIRRYLSKLFKDNGYEVEVAKDGQEALQIIKESYFSLVILDVEMPVLDGIETLKEIMKIKPTRVLMLSSFVGKDYDATVQALEIGAIDYIYKPKSSVDIAKVSEDILSKVRHSLLIIPKFLNRKIEPFVTHKTNINIDIDMNFVLIGASTGGPRLIENICKTLPADYPHCVCIVQHMPSNFISNFIRRLNSICDIEIVEADNGVEMKKSRIIIAKGGKHLHFRKKFKTFTASLSSNVRDRFFVPSVDEMFLSAVEVLPAEKILAVELTGIGDDGADGMVELRKKGAYTIAESEKTAVVYGMPKEAFIRGGASKVLDFNDILDEIIKFAQ